MAQFHSITVTLVMLAAFIRPVAWPSSAPMIQVKPPRIAAVVERASGKLYLRVTNPDQTEEFRGSAQVRFDSSTPSETIRLSLELAPGESRYFPIGAPKSPNEQYLLTIYNQAGALVLFKAAPVNLAPTTTIEPARPAAIKKGDEISIQTRLTRSSPYSGADIQAPEQPVPLSLIFDLATRTPLTQANLTISSRNFEQHQPVTVHDRGQVEFKLPDELSERKLKYTLTDSTGQVRGSGEIDLDDLMMADAMTVSSVTFDRTSYAPGESARLVIELQGQTTRSFRLEVTAKEGNNPLYEDARKDAALAGQSRQEFTIEIPSNIKEPLTLEYKVFSAQTKALFDSGIRQIPLSDGSQKPGANGSQRISP